MIHDGIVGTGQKLAGKWMSKNLESYSIVFNAKLYPGTLNVYVRGEHSFFGDGYEGHGFHPAGIRISGKIKALPCLINGIDAFMVRSERGGPAPAELMEPPRTLFEIISGTCFRKDCGFTDGSPVKLQYDRSEIKEYPAIGLEWID